MKVDNNKAPFEGAASLMSLGIGMSVGKSLIASVVEKFFEIDSLPVQVNYVDWWPRTCGKVKKLASAFWDSRIKGAVISSACTAGLVGAMLLSKSCPNTAGRIWNLATDTTQRFLGLFGVANLGQWTQDMATYWFMSTLVGAGTALAAGSYNLIERHFTPDRVLETKPIFSATLQKDLDEILSTATILKEEKGFLQNLLLYGPPGTGKTMISKWISTNSKMNYIFISGGDLLKSMQSKSKKSGEASGPVAMLQKVIDHAKNLSSPTVVFIDEAEAVLKKRDMEKSSEFVSLLNAFLELTGQPSAKLMLILATNRPNDIDRAVLSRMDYKIYVGNPELAEREKIIEKNVGILVTSPEYRSLFTKSIMHHIAQQSQGFSGRDIFKLINRLKIEARRTGALNTISINEVIAKFMKQERQIEEQENENPFSGNPFWEGQMDGSRREIRAI